MKRLFLAVAAVASLAQAQNDEGPGRGVARISVINGDVSVRRGDSGDQIAAALNAPLVVDDRIYTGTASRAEVQFDYANMARLAGDTELRFAELEHRRYTVQVARGTITWRVLREGERSETDISTPSISVRPIKRGTYRVTVQEDGTTEITVRSGEAEVFTPRGSQRLGEGRTMLTRGNSNDPEFQFVSEIRRDDWDRWNEARDRDLERSRSYRYVSSDIYGAEDLDDHGRWVNVPGYGWVWAPHAAPGWAPYRHGRWSWIDWYGWTWISYDPWGWAPYHYGRWFWHAPVGWCWFPGPRLGRHWWSPALVAFVGFGNVHVGVGWGGWGYGRVGWIPLAPHDPFHRWWGRGWYGGFRDRRYIDNSVRIVNNVNITNIYRNSRINNAVTGVDVDGFSRGRAGQVVRVSDRDFSSRAGLVQGPLPLAPERDSLRWNDRESPRTVRVSNDSMRFHTRREIARVDRVPFDEQRRVLSEATRGASREDMVRGGAVGRTERSVATAESGSSRGWRDYGESRTTGREAENRGERGSDGWRRFGEPSVRGGETRETVRGERSLDTRGGSDGWRRFGEPVVRGGGTSETREAVRGGERGERGVETRSSDRSGGFGERRGEARGAETRGSETRGGDSNWRRDWPSRSESPRSEPRSERGGDRSGPESRGEIRGDRSDGGSIRMTPPIVRERSSGREGYGSRGGDRGGWSGSPRSETRSSGGERSGGGGWSGGSRGEARSSGGGDGARGGESAGSGGAGGRTSGGGGAGRSAGGGGRGR